MSKCQFPRENASRDEITNILRNTRTLAIIGISQDPSKDSHSVAKYLIDVGYDVIPVNPKYDEVLGLKCYPDLKSIPQHVDLVNIFRKPEALSEIVDEAIDIKADYIWMQLGLCDNDSADKARLNGLKVVMNKCIRVEHMDLL